MAEVHSEWVCPECGCRYGSPLVGTSEVGHTCRNGTTVRFVKFKRVAESKYNRMKG